jgi:uncharacterized protein YaaW (UPF0174 family)
VRNTLDERDFVPGGSERSKLGKGRRLKRLNRSKNTDMGSRFAELMTKNFQKELRNSEIWDQMVAQFGEKRAEEILKECKAEVKQGI